MKADNLFRFVSIRPPGDDQSIEPISGDVGVIEEVGGRMAHNLGLGRSASDSAMDTGREIINGDGYIRSREWGNDLLGLTRRVQGLLRKAKEDLDWDSFQEEGQKLLAGLNPSKTSAEAFLKSDTFADFEQTLWRSFFGTFLNPYERPKDYEFLRSWLVLVHLLKSKTAPEFSRRASKIQSTRPSVPASFFFALPAPAEGAEPAGQALERQPDPVAEKAHRVRDQIARLEEARKQLNDLFAARVRTAAYAVQTSAVKSLESPRSPEADRRVPPSAARQSSSSIGSTQAPVWKLTADDSRSHERLIETIRAAGIFVELSSIPDAINRLDTHIATLNAELGQVQAARDIALVGKTFVRVRRPTALTFRRVPR